MIAACIYIWPEVVFLYIPENVAMGDKSGMLFTYLSINNVKIYLKF